MIKKAINNPERIVDEVIEGLVFASHGRLTKVPGVHAVMRTSIEDGKVALLIGGGSGHEPIYTTYVGPGFADAAACGNIFAAPSPQIIFEATKAIHRGRGVLYVYGNYEGDVMNFDVAAEMAADEGIEVKYARTMDDVSLPKGEGRRGIAGSYFQVKIAGAACASGLSLKDAQRVTMHAQQNIRSLSVALRPGSLPESSGLSFVSAKESKSSGERSASRAFDLPILLKVKIRGSARIHALTTRVLRNPHFDPVGHYVGRDDLQIRLCQSKSHDDLPEVRRHDCRGRQHLPALRSYPQPNLGHPGRACHNARDRGAVCSLTTLFVKLALDRGMNLAPVHVDSGRPLRASTGRWPTARQTGQVDPFRSDGTPCKWPEHAVKRSLFLGDDRLIAGTVRDLFSPDLRLTVGQQ